jgi:hypothetical protein
MKTIYATRPDKHVRPPPKPAGRPLIRVLGDALLSLAVHAAVVLLLIRFMVSPPTSDASRQIEVMVVEQESLPELEPEKDLLEPLPEDLMSEPPPQEWAGSSMTEEAVIEPREEQAVELQSIESRLVIPLMVDNAVSTRQLQRGQGTQFGHGEGLKGDIAGTMYDLKRDRKGTPRACHYAEDVRHILKEQLTRDAFSGFYRIPRPLYLSHLLIPYAGAEAGPESFGVSDLMEARQWVVHYTGELQTLQAGRYRLVGEFDDLLLVMVDGQIVLERFWSGEITDWKPKDHVQQHRSFTGAPLTYGDWFELNSMQLRHLDILVGENPGGRVGGVLLIQREGEDYATESDGRPILPIFALQPLTPDEEQKLATFAGMKFDPRVPVMGARSDWKAAAAAKPKDEVSVIIE